jgi:arylsulfatase A-like enzyme
VSELYAQAIKNINNISKDELNDLGKLYHASIDYVDDQISRILDQLKASGHLSNTLVVLTSDHGELAGEHGQFGKPARMYDELLQVPLIIVNCPNSVMEARDELVSLLDIPPLIHHSLGLENSHKYEGQVPGEDSPRNYILAEHEVEGEVIIGARSTQWMYEADEIEGTHRLFDLSEGRANRVPVDDYPDNFTKEVVLERLQKLDVKMHRLEDEVEGDVKSRLKDLGYIN